jgi:hypothetical protein
MSRTLWASLDKKMEKVCGGRVLSAITKALWMMKGHPIVIYDSLACEGLRQLKYKVRDRNYEAYSRSWFDFFDCSESQLKKAQEWLLSSGVAEELAKEWGADWQKVRKFINSSDFQNRVIDKHLWRLGQEAKQVNA